MLNLIRQIINQFRFVLKLNYYDYYMSKAIMTKTKLVRKAFCLAIIFILIGVSSCSQIFLSITNFGQIVRIPLQNYLSNAKTCQIDYDQSSQNISQLFSINFESPLLNITSTYMKFNISAGSALLSNFKIHTIREVYNQPIKLFLLENNTLLLYSYRQHCSELQLNSQGSCTGFSQEGNYQIIIPYQLTSKLKNKKAVCEKMDIQEQGGDYGVIVLCTLTNRTSTVVQILWLDLLQNDQGYFYGMLFVDSQILQPPKYSQQVPQEQLGYIKQIEVFDQNQGQKVDAAYNCAEFSLKYFQKVTFAKTFFKKTIVYCSRLQQKDKFPFIYYLSFNLNRFKLVITPFQVNQLVTSCMNNALRVIPYLNGFLSVKKSNSLLSTTSLYQYYQSAPFSPSTCEELFSIQNFKYITTHDVSSVVEKQSTTIYIIFDNKVIVKQSYSSNYLEYQIDNLGYQLKSYALTSQFLYLFFTDKNYGSNQTMILIYSADQRQFKLVDRIISPDEQRTYTFFSVNNYLERGSYFFVYDIASDIISLQKYRGYQMKIEVINAQRAIGNNQLVIKTNDTDLEDFDLHQGNQQFTLTIYVKVRKFDDQTVSKIEDISDLDFDFNMFKINLNNYISGPNPKFFLRTNPKAKHQYLNHYQKANISQYLTFDGRNLLQCAINTELQQPIISFFYRGLYLLNCQLYYQTTNYEFQIGHCAKPMQFKTEIYYPMHLIVLAADKFLQYDISFAEICTITANTQINVCQRIYSTDYDSKFQPFLINKIKIANYVRRNNGSQLIEVFLVGSQMLIAANFQRSSSQNSKYVYTQAFNITKSQIPDLSNKLSINDIYFDIGYSRYLMVHLVKEVQQEQISISLRDNVILIYDRPIIIPDSLKYVGHLIASIKSSQIVAAMCLTVDNKDIMVVAYQVEGNQFLIKEYQITKSFEIIYRRTYPLYGKQILRRGDHRTDGKQVYFQVAESSQSNSKFHFFVYSPKYQTTGVQSHSLSASNRSKINFVQTTGNKFNKSSIGILDGVIFTVCQPQLIFQASDTKVPTQLSENSEQQGATIKGIVSLGLVDNTKLMSLIDIPFQINNKNYRIKLDQDYHRIELRNNQSIYYFTLPVSHIEGPVMQYQINASECQFLNYKQYDLFTKRQCLVYINPHFYGELLDFTSIQSKQNVFIQVFVTSTSYVCVQNRIFKKKIDKIFTSNECSMTHKDRYKTFVTCVQNQGTNIYYVDIGDSCQNLKVSIITRPSWLSYYRYFKIKYQEPTAVFQILVIAPNTKIYFVAQFDDSSYQFSSNYSQLIKDEQESFASSDYSLGSGYIWLLQNGIGVYRASTTSSQLNYITWLQISAIQYMVGISPPYTYIDTLISLSNQFLKFELGTPTEGYQMMISRDDGSLHISYTYQQISNCYNNVLSKSRTYQGIVVRMCNFIPEEYAIFGNFIPIENLQKKTYLQFYMKNTDKNYSYPFRMEDVNSNYYQINHGGYLVVGSIFNFACYYSLDSYVKWQFSLIGYGQPKSSRYMARKAKDSNEKMCNAVITLSNVNFKTIYTLQIEDTTPVDPQNIWRSWVHRGVIIILIFNFLRLFYIKRAEQRRLRKVIHHPKMIEDQFELQVKISSKKLL